MLHTSLLLQMMDALC